MKNFKITIVAALLGVMVLAVKSGASVAEITLLKGEIKYHSAEEELWQPAELGLQLEAGSAVKSGADSEVELSFYNGHQANLGANSSMQIKSMGNDTTLELFQGKLKSKVKELTKNQNYKVNTTEGVASVRGTIFEVVKAGDNTDVKVESGSVNVKELLTGIAVEVNAGSFSRVIKNHPPTPPADLESYREPSSANGDDQTLDTGAEGEDVADNGEADEDDKDGAPVLSGDALKEDLRREMRLAVSEINADINSARDLQQHQKESDVATGRTLRDVHGNLVRVEQHVLRPDNNTIGIINITKRSNYKYAGRFKARKTTNARLDTVEFQARFNKTMPEKLSGWGSFLIDLSDDEEINFHPERIKVEIANKIGQDRESILMTSIWDADDEDLSEPTIQFITASKGTWTVDNDAEDVGDGITWDPDVSDSESFEMWAVSPGLVLTQGNETMKVRMGIESWLINNDGKVLDAESLLGYKNSVNPFEIIRNIAVENSLMVRDYGGIALIDDGYNQDNLTEADYTAIVNEFNRGAPFFKYNMDNVLTPDFAIPVLESAAADMASGI
ncbi:MAG: FecR family protein [Elusimicrobiota bacterium]|nr:FecR family protein [Elusimicrobiota bacterium]